MTQNHPTNSPDPSSSESDELSSPEPIEKPAKKRQSPPHNVDTPTTEARGNLQESPELGSPTRSEASSTTGSDIEKAMIDCEQAASSKIIRFSRGQRSHDLEDDFLSRRDVFLAIASVWVEQNERPEEVSHMAGTDIGGTLISYVGLHCLR